MTDADPAGVKVPPTSVEFVVKCADLDAAIEFYNALGFRMDMIMPADAPRIALVSGHGITLRLEVASSKTLPASEFALRLLVNSEQWLATAAKSVIAPGGMQIEFVDRDSPIRVPEARQEFMISRADTADAWVAGRAGMQYRDLIPGRLGGRYIASQIRIPDGGPIPDYVHFHRVGFQMIYCKQGWVRVVYEDQGPPFVLHAGDCVLQPPTIRHRVLESSPGLEVIEIGCPAEHETYRDHELELPTPHLRPERRFGGQLFVRHVASEARWQRTTSAAEPGDAWEFRDTGIAHATDAMADVRIVRAAMNASDSHCKSATKVHTGDLMFLFVLDGQLDLLSQALGTHALGTGDACVIPVGADYALDARSACEILEVATWNRHVA
jgi:quercetin dioxygenase-like cupin family protein